MKFTLTIELGNDAMQRPFEVAAALRETAEKIDAYSPLVLWEDLTAYDSNGSIHDLNGNRVGKWGVK